MPPLTAITYSPYAPQPVAGSRLARVDMMIADETRSVWLKLEMDNPSGSVKHRTALGLVQQLESEGGLDEGRILLESTSGNLGIALALVAGQRGLRLCAVVDPKVQPPLLTKMRALGAMVEMVDTPDPQGNYLDARLARVEDLASSSPMYIWTNQYEAPANPAVHAATTGPELWRQSGGAIDALFIAVSTGGTLAGVSRYLRDVAPHVPVIAVDAVGSAALGHEVGPRHLTGIGSSRVSAFIEPWMYKSSILVSDAEAFAMCRVLEEVTGISVGGSSGAVLFACSRYLEDHPDVRCPVCLCADSGANYTRTIFNDSWLEQNDLLYPLTSMRRRFA